MTHICRIDWIDESGLAPTLDRDRVQRVVEAAMGEDGQDGCLLTVLIVGDAESARLHREHFDDSEPTDVMTFPDGALDPETDWQRLGDLAVNAELAARVGVERGRSADDELTLYVLHGLLHLLGYDDEDEADRLAMWAAQQRLLGGVGIVIESAPD